MSLIDELNRRFRTGWLNDPELRKYHHAMTSAIDDAENLRTERVTHEKAGKLSAAGLTEVMRDYAVKKVIPGLAENRLKLERAAVKVAEKRKALGIPKPDPKDAVGAILRSEARSLMRSMSQGQLAELLLKNPDPISVAAAFENPMLLPNLTAELRQRVEHALVEASHPDALAAIADEKEAITLANQAVNYAIGELQRSTSFEGNQHAFNQFVEEASRDVVSRFQRHGASDARVDLEGMIAKVKAMTVDDRQKLGDEIFSLNQAAHEARIAELTGEAA